MEIIINKYEILNDVVYYELNVKIKESLSSKSYLCRYSELLEINVLFEKQNINKSIPKFPKKSLLSNNSISFIKNRIELFDTYFKNINKYLYKLNYNINSWLNYFKNKNCIIIEKYEKEFQTNNILLNNKIENLSFVLNKSLIESIYDDFYSKLVLYEAKYIDPSICLRNNKQINLGLNINKFEINTIKNEYTNILDFIKIGNETLDDISILIKSKNQNSNVLISYNFYQPLILSID